jgi:hypothetical protein
LITPPFPECTSGHSTFSAAAATVLASFYQTDKISFSIGSDQLPGITHSFKRLSDVAEESGMSRVYGGIHFRTANLEGQASGVELGNYVAENFILPLSP